MNEEFITIRPSQDRPITWTMSYDGETRSAGNFPTVCLPKNSGAHWITFTIDNPDGMDIEFSDDPIWIRRSETCPTAHVVDKKQIKAKYKHNDGQLVIKNINKGEKQTLSYQLNFVDDNDPDHEVTPLDPQIKNGGGNGPGQGVYFEVQHVLIGVGLAAAAFIAYRLFVRFR